MADHIGNELGAEWEGFGMTKPREMPNNAAEARDQSAELCIEALRALHPIIHGVNITERDEMRRIGLVAKSIEEILRRMESVGAKTSPLDEYWAPRIGVSGG